MRLSTRKKFTAFGAAMVLALLMSLGLAASPASAEPFHVMQDSEIIIEANILGQIDVILVENLCELEEVDWLCEGWHVLAGAIQSVIILADTEFVEHDYFELTNIRINLGDGCYLNLLDPVRAESDPLELDLYLYDNKLGHYELTELCDPILVAIINAELNGVLLGGGIWFSCNNVTANFLIELA